MNNKESGTQIHIKVEHDNFELHCTHLPKQLPTNPEKDTVQNLTYSTL